MVEVDVLIPTADNAGLMFLPAHHAIFEQFVLALFPGFSLQPGTVSGAWTDAGTVYRDELRVYTLRVSGLIANGPALREVIDFAKSHYAQLALYARYLNVSEIL